MGWTIPIGGKIFAGTRVAGFDSYYYHIDFYLEHSICKKLTIFAAGKFTKISFIVF